MAAVSIPPSPQTFSMMSSRRIPLAHVPNAANSPFRAVAAAASKRSRSHSSVQREIPYGQPPPAKKQMIERDESSLRTPPRRPPTQDPEARVFTRKTTGALPTAFERRLVAAREAKAQQQKGLKHEKISIDNLESIRQWQKHYRKAFPQFVFYFESIPEDVRSKLAKQIASLGAREEKFFSKAVTHVVTTRTLPPDGVATRIAGPMPPPSTSTFAHSTDQPRTIDPSLLERSMETLNTQGIAFPSKSKFTFEPPVGRRFEAHGHPIVEPRRHGGNVDILSRAKEMGMKLWALEKLQRILTTMFDTDTGLHQPGLDTRSNVVITNKVDLSALLQNERLTGPSDRDPAVGTTEHIPFRGPYIYVHDMDEKTKPIMVREYPKVSHREDGEWPQFRSTGNGKCPFVEDLSCSKHEMAKERARERQILAKRERREKESQDAARTRAAVTADATEPQPHKQERAGRPLSESQLQIIKTSKPEESAANGLFEPPRIIPAKRGSPGKALKGFAAVFRRPSLFAEPVASGVQPSNITSAIRSQMISSTAAAPGAKAGTSKEVHELKRKVLEKNTGPSINGLSQPSRMADATAGISGTRNIPTVQAAKRKAQEKKLGYIEEDVTPSEDETNARTLDQARRSTAARSKKLEKRAPKPGYCENCQEKFEDFDYHTGSRKHRKFALNTNNWSELDDLLKDLARPLKEE